MSYLNNKPGSLEEIAAKMSKGIQDEDYQALFKKELEKAGKGIGSMTPAEKKAFFNKIDSMHKAKNESIEEKVDNPYAVGMAAAMKQTGDKPPLKKSTITKAHDIAKSIQKDEEPKADKMNKQQKDAGGEKKVVKEGGISDYLIDLEDDAADMSLQDFLKKHKNGMASLPDLKQIWKRVNESVNEEEKETEEVKSLRDTIHDVWNQAANEEEKREEDAKWLKTEAKSEIKCPNCGHMNDADAKKCSNCGHDLTKSEEKDSKKKTMTGSPASKVDTTPEVEFEK